jgi:hypothetical protein
VGFEVRNERVKRGMDVVERLLGVDSEHRNGAGFAEFDQSALF